MRVKGSLVYLSGGIGLTILASLWTILHISFGSWILIPAWFFLGTIFSGSLLAAQLLDNRKLSFSEWVICSAGFGLILLIALGLGMNTIGINIHHAVLTTNIVLVTFDILLGCLSLATILRKRISCLLPNPKPASTGVKLIALVPFLFPAISVLGANRLNNGASGGLTVGLYVCMIAFVGTIIVFKKLQNEYVFSSTLWAISFAILLSVSMRSNHLIGYDINQEFQVFTATLRDGLWHAHLFKNTYNACLSITILPTMLKVLMPISPDYLFKFVMQGIFCFSSIGVYVLARYFMGNRKKAATYAFISAVFFIVQYQFLNEFPALIREQVATVFFTLVFISAVTQKLSNSLRSILILMFGLGMIVSHYSTAYICLGLLLLMIIIKPILIKASGHFNIPSFKRPKESSWYISKMIVVILFLLSFMWYAEILSSTGGIVEKIGSSIAGLDQTFSSGSRSSFVNSTFGISNSVENPETLNRASVARNSGNSYSNAMHKNYEVFPALTPAPQVGNSYQVLLLKIINRYIPALVKLAVILGSFYIIITSLKNKRPLEDGVMVIAAGIIFILMIALPSLSQEYNLERLYQQLLVLLSSSFVLGVIVVANYIKVKHAETAAFVILVAYFMCTSGVFSQLAFGMSNINFDNLDLNYVHFYSTDGDINALTWLQGPYGEQSSIINIDSYSKLKTYSNTDLPSYDLVPGLLPTQITPGAYVYASSINLQHNIVFDSYNKQALTYTFPRAFLNDNKNTIYSNKDSEIYR